MCLIRILSIALLALGISGCFFGPGNPPPAQNEPDLEDPRGTDPPLNTGDGGLPDDADVNPHLGDGGLFDDADINPDSGEPDSGDGGIEPDLGVLDTPVAAALTITSSGILASGGPYYTLSPGTEVLLSASHQCTQLGVKCRLAWSRNGTPLDSDPTLAAIVLGTEQALAHYNLQVYDGADSLVDSADIYLATWTGVWVDNFDGDGGLFDYVSRGWYTPLRQILEIQEAYTLVDNRLQISHVDNEAPASTGLRAGPLVADARVDVELVRSATTGQTHYSDIIFRMSPSDLQQRFYRVRFQEGPTLEGDGEQSDFVEICIFKIVPGQGELYEEHGAVLNDTNGGNPPGPLTPPGMEECARTFPVSRDIRLKLEAEIRTEIQDGKSVVVFDVRLRDAAKLDEVLFEVLGVKDEFDPILEAGFVGLTHFNGVTQFDNFKLTTVLPTLSFASYFDSLHIFSPWRGGLLSVF